MALTEPRVQGGHAEGFAAHTRTDNWWVGPLLTFLGFSAFIVYSTWAAFQAEHYWHISYLSPMYSPPLFIDTAAVGAAPIEHAWLGEWPDWWPAILPASPAFLILAFPGAFRFTCYYYRKAYYRTFAGTPPACAVGAVPQGKFRGETRLLLFQNLHRYALYFAIAFIFILFYDALLAFWYDADGDGSREFGLGVGSIVLLINPILLGAYTFGCHSWRHIIGGRLDCFSCDAASQFRHKAWTRVSWLNDRHMEFAWLSLFWVGFTDLYVRLCSMGIITDLNTWGA